MEPAFRSARAMASALAALAVACGAPAPSPAPSPSGPPPAAAASAAPVPQVSPLPEPLPPVVARVNGRPIPLGYARVIADEQLRGRNPTATEKALAYRKAVDQLVVRELMLQEARRRGLAADPAKVKQMYDAVRSEHPSEEAWREFLSGKGLDARTFRDELEVRHTVEALVKSVTEAVPATIADAEARAYYEANRANFETGGRAATFAEARRQIDAQLVVFKRQEALNALLQRLRAAAAVEVLI